MFMQQYITSLGHTIGMESGLDSNWYRNGVCSTLLDNYMKAERVKPVHTMESKYIKEIKEVHFKIGKRTVASF